MARYHIDDNNEVVKCRAWIRSCKFEDYETEREARYELSVKIAKAEYDADYAYVQKKFSNKNATRSFCGVDFSGASKEKTLRNYMNELDKEYYSQGSIPDFFSVMSQLRQSNISSNSSSYQKVYASRSPIPDYTNAVVTSKWRLKVEPAGPWKPNNYVEYELDLHNDFANEMIRAEKIISETVITNYSRGATVGDVNAQSKFMVDQLGMAYSVIEELDSERGSWDSWTTAEGYGNFANSDIMNLIVDVDYQTSSFNSHLFRDFLLTNEYYKACFPSVISVRVFDNELKKSKNDWSVHYSDGKWTIFAQIDGKMHSDEITDADRAYHIVKDYVKGYMLTNDDETAEEKAVYTRDLILGVNDAIKSFVQWKDENPLY